MPKAGPLLYDDRGRAIRFGGGSNRLIGPSQQNTDRKRVPLLNSDIHRNLSSYGRTILLSLGRHIYWASGAIRGAIEDTCTFAAGSFMFESRSKNRRFKTQSEDLLYAHDRVADVAGPPNTMRSYRKMLMRSLFLDGDMGTVYLWDDKTGQPFLQVIPSHRICYPKETIMGGPWDGSRVIDGVIVDGFNRAVAYCVKVDSGGDALGFQYIPATAMALHFLPIVAGQVRGIPLLGLAAWNIQDLDEAQRWELLAQKAGAGRVFQEWNEDGEPQGEFITGPETGDNTAGTPTGLWRETIDAGINTYFKSDSGGRIEAVKFDRPSSNQQAFTSQVWRETMAGSRLSLDFNLDLSKLGGGPARLLVDKVQATYCDLQDDVVEPASRRFDFFRLSTFIYRTKELPEVDDWYRHEYQRGARLTADKRYDSQVTNDQVRIGIKTRSRGAMELGESLDDIRDTREAEDDDLYTRADRLSAKHPLVDYNVILNRLQTDNASLVGQEAGAAAKPEPAGATAAGEPDGDETGDDSPKPSNE